MSPHRELSSGSQRAGNIGLQKKNTHVCPACGQPLNDLSTITVEKVAALLHVRPEAVRIWAREGRLAAYKIGRRLRFRPEAVRAFQESKTVHITRPVTQKPADTPKRFRVRVIRRRDRRLMFALRTTDSKTGERKQEAIRGVKSRQIADHLAAQRERTLNGEPLLPEVPIVLPGARYTVSPVRRRGRSWPFMLNIHDRVTGHDRREVLRDVGTAERGRAYQLAAERQRLMNSLPRETPPVPWSKARKAILVFSEKQVNTATHRQYERALARMEEYASDQLEKPLEFLQQIDRTFVRGFASQRVQRVGPVTVNRNLRELGALWSRLPSVGYPVPNPWALFALPAPHRKDVVPRAAHKILKTLKKCAQAQLVLACHPDWTDAQIAAAVHISPRSLYRWSAYKDARKMAAAAKEELPRGQTRGEPIAEDRAAGFQDE